MVEPIMPHDPTAPEFDAATARAIARAVDADYRAAATLQSAAADLLARTAWVTCRIVPGGVGYDPEDLWAVARAFAGIDLEAHARVLEADYADRARAGEI